MIEFEKKAQTTKTYQVYTDHNDNYYYDWFSIDIVTSENGKICVYLYYEEYEKICYWTFDNITEDQVLNEIKKNMNERIDDYRFDADIL